MGHCLWSGIVDEDKAARSRNACSSAEMFSGWGVRTLGSDMGAYNPASYHNGSVWPHDNAIIAAGLMRYGFVEEANRIVLGLFEAASQFGGRLPELFCGFDRERVPRAGRPTRPPAHRRRGRRRRRSRCCAPPSASTRLFPTGEVWLAPTSAADFGDIHLRNVPFAGSRISVDASRREHLRRRPATRPHPAPDAARGLVHGAHPKGDPA